MAKTKTYTFNRRLAGLSIILILGVIVTGAHLKEVIMHLFNMPAPALVALDTPKKISDDSSTKKVAGDFHNHIEKQTLKNMVKIGGDDVARTDRRHIKHRARARKAKFPRFALHTALLHYFSV